GFNITDAISKATSNGYATMCASGGNHYVIMGGDLLFNSMSSYGSHPNLTAQVAYAQWISLVHSLKNSGCKVIVFTPNIGSTYAGGTGSSMSGTFVNRVQTAAQLIRNGIQGTDYDILVDLTSALQTNTDPTFFSYDNTHWTGAGGKSVAAFTNGAFLAGGGLNLAPYYNWPITVDNNGAWTLNLASCSSVACFNVVAGDGIPMSVTSTQTNQLSGLFFKDGATGTIQGHVGYANGTYGLGGNLVDVGPETGVTSTGTVIHGVSYGAYVEATNQLILYSSVVQFPQQAASSGHACLQVDASGYLSNTGSACGTSAMVWPTFTGLTKYGGSSNWVTPTYADVVTLFASGSCSGYLKSDGTCSTPGGGNMSDGSGSSTAGYFPATTSTPHTYAVDTNFDDGHTTANTFTVNEAFAVNCPSCA